MMHLISQSDMDKVMLATMMGNITADVFKEKFSSTEEYPTDSVTDIDKGKCSI